MRVAATILAPAMFVAGGAWANDAELIAFGEYLSGECVTCHQLSGADKGIPSIVGWDVDAFTEVIASYRTKERENKVMQTIAASLSDEDVKALAAYFASIEPKE